MSVGMRRMTALRYALLAGVAFLCVCTILNLFSFSGSDVVNDHSDSEPLDLQDAKQIAAPSDAIPKRFRDFCQFLEDPVSGAEGRLDNVGENFLLRGVLVLTRHGERSSITTDKELLASLSCVPFHETDRAAFENLIQIMESTDFRAFLRVDPALHDAGLFPHKSRCFGGQLTAEGALQHHKLGTFLKERYAQSNLFNGNDPTDVFTMTTNFHRTLQSLAALVSGFLYPLKNRTPSVFVNVSHTTRLCSDTEEWCRCDRAPAWRHQYEEEHLRYFLTKSHSKLREDCEVFKLLPASRGKSDPFEFLDIMLGFYVCRRTTLPCSRRGVCVRYELLQQLMDETSRRGEDMFVADSSQVPAKLQIAEAYSVLGKVTRLVRQLRENSRQNKIMLLSGHDVIVGPVLRTLRIPFDDPPRYASRIVFEIYSPRKVSASDDNLYFRILYNGAVVTPSVPFCRDSSDGLCQARHLEEFLDSGIWNNTSSKSLTSLCEGTT